MKPETGREMRRCLLNHAVNTIWPDDYRMVDPGEAARALHAAGDLAKCFAHHDGIEKHRAKLKKRESAELKKAGARLRRIAIKNHRAP